MLRAPSGVPWYLVEGPYEGILALGAPGTLLRATMKGHFFSFSRLMDSRVWGSRPCMMSTTKMAMSHREDPRFLRLLQSDRQRQTGYCSQTGRDRRVTAVRRGETDGLLQSDR